MQTNITNPQGNSKTLFLLVAFLCSIGLLAQKPMPVRDIEIRLDADEKITSEIKNQMRVNLETGFPLVLYGLNYEVPQGTPESIVQC